MAIQHHPIPVLPDSPHIRPIAGHITRSYPVGRQSFSRACKGKVMTLTITMEHPKHHDIQAKLVTNINSNGGRTWHTVPFNREEDQTLVCHVTPEYPGLYSFRTEFSLDQGASWHRDTLPDAWVLVDPPQVDGLLVYTMIPTISGTVADWKSDLKRIREMGFNTIHMLPITAMDTSESPYSARDLFDIDNSYLLKRSERDSLSQLEEFIEEAKVHGIRLCFDIVLNHVGINSTMAQRAPDWIVPDPDQKDGFQRARYWSNDRWQFWNDLILINYEHPSEAIRAEIWSYMIDYTLFWANYANETEGFIRFDNLHSSDPDFVKALTSALHAQYPNVGILAEYFTDETTLLHTGPRWKLNLNLATPWDYKFVPQLREYLKYIHRVSRHIRYFMPVTSHDSGSPAQEFGSVESVIPRYVAAALLGTGATGIIQGVEYGALEKIEFIGRKPRMQFPAEAKFARFISQVNSILAEYPAFRHGDNCLFLDDGHEAIIAAFRQDTGTQAKGFLVVCNFDIYHIQRIEIDLSPVIETGGPLTCYDLISSQSRTFQQPYLDLQLPPSSTMVLKI